MNSELSNDTIASSVNIIKKKTASLLSLIILVVIVFLLQAEMSSATKNFAVEGNLLKLLVIAKQLVCIFIPVVLTLVILRLPIRDTLGLYKPLWGRTAIAIILGFILIYTINLLLPMIFRPTQQLTQSTASIVAYSNIFEFLLTLVTISVVAPVVDETFFRGILLQGLRLKYSAIVAILVTALLTALFHKPEPFKLTHAFLMGVIFASSVVWTKSVYTSIMLHALHNSLSLIP
jgi:membrane protease YdiL (CAAX protease family)